MYGGTKAADHQNRDHRGALRGQNYGYELDPWQKDIVECWLGKDELGRYTVTSAGLSVPRQNGKNECLIGREFYGMTISGENSSFSSSASSSVSRVILVLCFLNSAE